MEHKKILAQYFLPGFIMLFICRYVLCSYVLFQMSASQTWKILLFFTIGGNTQEKRTPKQEKTLIVQENVYSVPF